MYERFTDAARRVMEKADREAQRLKHEYVGTEHVLLGLVKQRSGVAAEVLRNLNIRLDRIEREVELIVQPGPDSDATAAPDRTPRPLTPRAKRVVEYAIEEARAFNLDRADVEHMLLGLLREEEGVAAHVLMNRGLTLENVRHEILRILRPGKTTEECHVSAAVAAKDKTAPAPFEDHPLVKQMNRIITELREEKEASVDRQDFETAALARNQEAAMRRSLHEIIKVLIRNPEIGKKPTDAPNDI